MIGCGYATFFLHLHAHTRHATLGWGGVANNVQVYFHTHVMLRYCAFFLHMHTHTRHTTLLHVLLALAHTRHATLLHVLLALAHRRHAALLHVLLALAHTQTSCYATARSSCTCTQTSCYVGVGWGGLRSRLGKEVGHPLHSPLACIWLKYFIEHV